MAVARCRSYGREFELALDRAIDQIGGIGDLVRGRTVGLKLNLTGGPEAFPARPEMPFRNDPSTVLAAATLLARNGARRIRILESFEPAGQSPDLWARYGLDTQAIGNCGCPVEWENTNTLGTGSRYGRFAVPWGGYVFPAFDLNRAYEECDVYVSLAKLKNHWIAGVTLSIKNNFGIAPCSLYGGDAYPNGNENPRQNRSAVFHNGGPPATGVPQERDPLSPRDSGYRVPRITADLLGARPIDLAIIEGVDSIRGGEGPWNPGVQRVKPGLLLAGRNPVCTDAVAMAVMGYDPQALAGAAPFLRGDNTLALAEAAGIGAAAVSQIEIAGLSVDEARFDFGPGPIGTAIGVPGARLAAFSSARPCGMLAPGSLASLYGRSFSNDIGASPGDVRVEVADNAGATREARVLYVSSGQVNCVVPADTTPGPVRVIMTTAGGERLIVGEHVYRLAPAIFTADGSGSGVAAAYVVRHRSDGGQDWDLVFQCRSSATGTSCEAVPVSLGGPEDVAALVLFCTGIRRLTSPEQVHAAADDVQLPVLYAGPQPEYPGLDQVNLLMPPALAGRGSVEVRLEFEGEPANSVALRLA